MKYTIFILLAMGSSMAFGQIDFTKIVDKKEFKKANLHGDFDCIAGNCKNGLGVVKTTTISSLVYVIGNFENKQLNGEATILHIRDRYGEYDSKSMSLKAELKKHFEAGVIDEKVYTFYQKYSSGVREAFWGNFTENKLDSGLYTFRGNQEDVQKIRQISIPLTHFYNILDDKGKEVFINQKKDIEYRFRGAFTPEYGREYPALTLKTRDDFIEINTSWGSDVIIRKHHIPEFFEVTHYNARSEKVKEVLTHHNALGTTGWVKEFLIGFPTPYVSLVGHSGIVLYKETLENIGILPKEGTPYKDGMFYGSMTNGKPDNYGIYIDDYVLYDGFFNDKGEFDGYGFLTQRKNYPQQSWFWQYPNEYGLNKIAEEHKLAALGYFIGVFENGVFKQGDVGNTFGDKNRLELIRGEVKNKTQPKHVYAVKNYFLEGEGFKFNSSYTGWHIPDYPNSQLKVIEQGTFANNLLHGKGFRGDDYGEFVNGEMTAESKKIAAAVNAKKREEEIASTLANAKFPLGSIVKDQYGSYKYVNELFTHGSADLVNIPLEVPEYKLKDKSWDKFSIIYANSAYPLHAKPNFSMQYYTGFRVTNKEQEKYHLTNLRLCNQCNGKGSFTVKKETAGVSTNTTTTYERTYEGVFYDTYGNVTRTTSTPTTFVEWVNEDCQTCNGAGCH